MRWIFCVLVLFSASAGAQTEESDSTAATFPGLAGISRLARGDSLSTSLAESLAAARAALVLPSGFDWFTSLSPTARAGFRADVTKTTLNGNLQADAVWLDGAETSSSLSRTVTGYRQQDRDQVQTDFDASFRGDLGSLVDLDFSLGTGRSEYENRLTNGNRITLARANERARLQLKGGTSVVEGIRQSWAVQGQYENSRQDNRGTDNNRSLFKGGLSSRWVKDAREWKLTGKLGVLSERGNRQLLSNRAPAQARVDTLGANLDVDLGNSLKVNVIAERVRFVEERLELRRNSSGLIDTTGFDPKQQVGQERESRDSRRLSLDLKSRPYPSLAFDTSLGHEFTQTQYVFSPQGIVQTGQNSISGSSTFRYAQSGSLQTQLKFSDRYNDRRTQDSSAFRGRESRQVTEFRVDLGQHLFRATDLNMNVRKTLTQSINDDPTNKNDRDLLVTRASAELTSQAIGAVELSAGATYSTSDEINIDAERVGDNKRDTLLEVRGGYTYHPNGSLQILQNYRLQIVFVDIFLSNDRDQFNKQGQLRNEISYLFTSGASFRLEYLVDFRKNGRRVDEEIYREIYRSELRRFDHQFKARLKLPWKDFSLETWAVRGFLRETRGFIDNAEDRGEFHLRVGGNRQFLERKVRLSLDLERILQFGPRVREEAEDYWRADTSISVVF